MEPRIRILFISYIVVLLLIMGIGVVPYFVKGEYKMDTAVVETTRKKAKEKKPDETALVVEPVRPEAADATEHSDDSFAGTVHVIETDAQTHLVRFELVDDEATFEQANDQLFALMDGRNGSDFVITYKKKADRDGNLLYNFSESHEIASER